MENREQQILSEIKTMMSSIRSQLELLDAKMAELQHAVDPQDVDMVPIDLEIDIAEPEVASEPVAVEPVAEEQAVEAPAAEEPVVEEPAADIPDDDDLPMSEDEPVVTESVAVEDSPDDDLPMFMDPEPEPEQESEPECVPEPVPEPKQTVIDAMTARQAWRTDMPGTQVKDIRSAISLNDRIFFINYLFNEDPMAFQDALTRINQMNTLDEVVEMAVTEHPDWNLDSEVVYRFMMAVRRRIR